MAELRWRFLVIALLCVSGCDRKLRWGSGQYGAIHRPGGGRYTVQYLTCDDRPYLVVWADGCDLVAEDKLGCGDNVWGVIIASDRRKVVWCGETTSKYAGRDGTLCLNDNNKSGPSFRLSSGGLFLVHGRESPVRVEQVAADLSAAGLTPEPDELLRASGADPRVAAFHAQCLGKR